MSTDGGVVRLQRDRPPHEGEWVLPGGLVERVRPGGLRPRGPGGGRADGSSGLVRRPVRRPPPGAARQRLGGVPLRAAGGRGADGPRGGPAGRHRRPREPALGGGRVGWPDTTTPVADQHAGAVPADEGADTRWLPTAPVAPVRSTYIPHRRARTVSGRLAVLSPATGRSTGRPGAGAGRVGLPRAKADRGRQSLAVAAPVVATSRPWSLPMRQRSASTAPNPATSSPVTT